MRTDGLTPDQLDDEQQRLYAEITAGPRGSGTQHFPLVREDGSLSGPFGLMLIQPALGRPLQALGSAVRFETGLTGRIREIAILAVAAATACEFERYAHERVGRAAGLTDDELDALNQQRFVGRDDRERAAYDFCVDLLTEGRVHSDEEFALLETELGAPTVMELLVLVGYYRTLSQMLNLFDVQP